MELKRPTDDIDHLKEYSMSKPVSQCSLDITRCSFIPLSWHMAAVNSVEQNGNIMKTQDPILTNGTCNWIFNDLGN
ncbi:MAG: hypothetical protein ABI373_06325 [Flavobacteriales bacterium]